MSITVTGVEGVRAMLLKIGQQMAPQILAKTAESTEYYIRGEAGKHEKTGHLNSSIFKQLQSDGSWHVGHDEKRAFYAQFVIGGTKPHDIFPVNKKALRWPAGSKFIFSKWVKHPGNKPDNWIERAATFAPLQFKAFTEDYIAQLPKG